MDILTSPSQLCYRRDLAQQQRNCTRKTEASTFQEGPGPFTDIDDQSRLVDAVWQRLLRYSE